MYPPPRRIIQATSGTSLLRLLFLHYQNEKQGANLWVAHSTFQQEGAGVVCVRFPTSTVGPEPPSTCNTSTSTSLQCLTEYGFIPGAKGTPELASRLRATDSHKGVSRAFRHRGLGHVTATGKRGKERRGRGA